MEKSPEILNQVWFSAISQALGDSYKFSHGQKIELANSLYSYLSWDKAQKHIKILDNQKVEEMVSHIEQVNKHLVRLSYLFDDVSFFESAYVHLSEQEKQRFSDAINHFKVLEESILRKKKTKNGPDNREAMEICLIIRDHFCFLGLGKAAISNSYPVQGELGELQGGSPYERVCEAVSKLMDIHLAKSTRIKACK